MGRAIRQYASREKIVLAAKVFSPALSGPGGRGLSRKAILQQIDALLTRLQTGARYVDASSV